MNKRLEELLDHAAGTLMLADPDDATTMNELNSIFSDLHLLLSEHKQTVCAHAVNQIMQALSACDAMGSEQCNKLIDWTGQLIDVLQQVALGRMDDTAAQAVFEPLLIFQGNTRDAPAIDQVDLQETNEPQPPVAVPDEQESSPPLDQEPSQPTTDKKVDQQEIKDSIAVLNDDILQEEQLAGRYLTFFLAREEYGIEIIKVQEIIRMTEITRIPRTPDYIRGLINLRGQVVAVIDLRAKFKLPRIENTEHTCIIVVKVRFKTGYATMGMIVDAVSEVLQISANEIKPADKLAANLDSRYLLGMAIVHENVKILLDVNRIVAISDDPLSDHAGDVD